MKKVILSKLGIKGLIHMLQVFVFSVICVFAHTVLVPQFVGLLPIALLMGIISIQPTSGFTKKAMPKIGIMFAAACFIVGISSTFFDTNVYVYFVVMVIALLIINFLMPQKYMVITMAVGTALFFLDTSDMSVPYWFVLIIALIDVAIFFVVVRLIVHFIHIPIEKMIQMMMKQTMGLFQKELQTMLIKGEKGRPKPLYGIFIQSQMLIHEYASGKNKQEAHVVVYQKVLTSYLRVYFSLTTISELNQYQVSETKAKELASLGFQKVPVSEMEDPILAFHLGEYVEGMREIRTSLETLKGGQAE
ncbi:hypothetical protein [Listeria riparia]|uniref:Uncharacterized protein n=1 Tax=Listeria riparia FSL S10-1204 TaxID=1265816 RepID=W7DNF2_9LIST|nr:hypothetical protein [Listeria riparia]EUJ46823.1 hypothetical protein PRIP_00804 [Listeria riparia FSL S10-1204]